MLVNATAMLKSAEKGHYAIGAFNTNNLEWASSILDAAEELQSPVIIQCTSGAAKWQGSYKVCADIVKQLVEDKGITVPVALHLDHGTYEDVFKCIEAGFTSVMYDGSHEASFEINLERTAEVVKAAHAKGHLGRGRGRRHRRRRGRRCLQGRAGRPRAVQGHRRPGR